MHKRTRYKENLEGLDIYPAFTDLMSNAFMILSLFLLLALFQLQGSNRKLKEANERLKMSFPITIDEKSGNFTFASKSAELPKPLQNYLRTDTIPKIKEIIAKKEIDFVQIIGHTDGEEINQTGNLDTNIENFAKGKPDVKPTPASNADLGLMRALAVVKFIKDKTEKIEELKGVKFRAYSAGQLYLPPFDDLAPIDRKENKKRRRIEIRFIPKGEKK